MQTELLKEYTMLKEKYIDKKKYEKDLIDSILYVIERNHGENILTSIILTGSFGRNEPTYLISDDGYLVLKSDVEIACVYKTDKVKADALIQRVKREFREDLNLMSISERRVKNAYNFNGSFITPKYKTIFMYDLFNGSKTIWGKDFIGSKHLGIDSCDPYEAKRLVANRIGELVYLSNIAASDAGVLRKQWKSKLILAIASGWLICEKKYVSSYRHQLKKIEEDSTLVANVLGDSFFEDYYKSFSFLRDSGDPFEVDNERLRIYARRINEYYVEKGLTKPRVNSVSRFVKYSLKYVRTVKGYGILNFEDGILQSLITQFANSDSRVKDTAEIWHRVLY